MAREKKQSWSCTTNACILESRNYICCRPDFIRKGSDKRILILTQAEGNLQRRGITWRQRANGRTVYLAYQPCHILKHDLPCPC